MKGGKLNYASPLADYAKVANIIFFAAGFLANISMLGFNPRIFSADDVKDSPLQKAACRGIHEANVGSLKSSAFLPLAPYTNHDLYLAGSTIVLHLLSITRELVLR